MNGVFEVPARRAVLHCKVNVTTFGVNFTTNVGHYTVVNMIISDGHYQLVVTVNTCYFKVFHILFRLVTITD